MRTLPRQTEFDFLWRSEHCSKWILGLPFHKDLKALKHFFWGRQKVFLLDTFHPQEVDNLEFLAGHLAKARRGRFDCRSPPLPDMEPFPIQGLLCWGWCDHLRRPEQFYLELAEPNSRPSA